MKRSDIGPLIVLTLFNCIATGFFQIVNYGIKHPEKHLTFFENYMGPSVWWPGLTLITYAVVLFYRSEIGKKKSTDLVARVDKPIVDIADNA